MSARFGWPRSAVIALCGVALMLAACGDDPDDSSPTAPAAATASPEAQTPLATPSQAAGPVTSGGGPVATGDAALDALLRTLEAQDVDALLALIRYDPIRCIPDYQRPEVPYPTCPTPVSDDPDGRTVPAFAVDGCGRDFLTEAEQLRERVDGIFAGSSESSIYAVVRRAQSKAGDVATEIILGAGGTPSATARATHWKFDDEGKLIALVAPCQPWTAAEMAITYFMDGTSGDLLVRPRLSCDPGAFDTPLNILRIWRDDDGPLVFVAGLDVGDGPDDERVWVTVREPDPATGGLQSGGRPLPPEARAVEFRGSVTTIRAVEAGRRFRVTGWRLANCDVEAWTIERS
ncbi:MAG: hypothetical protein WEC75_14005 [Dehalococcoidia bacterium]